MVFLSYITLNQKITYNIAHCIKDNGRNSKTNPGEGESAILTFNGVFNLRNEKFNYLQITLGTDRTIIS